MCIGGGRSRGRGCGVAAEAHGGGYDCEAIFAVVDSSAVGEDVDVGALGAELAVTLGVVISREILVIVKVDEQGERRWSHGGWDENTLAYLGKVFADSLGGGTKLMTKRTGIASLTGTLAKELAGNMGSVY